jgi:hypothetical protein
VGQRPTPVDRGSGEAAQSLALVSAGSRAGALPAFTVLPRRWVVERTFGWLGMNRRLSKDYERVPETGEAWIYLGMSRLLLRRLTAQTTPWRKKQAA